MCGMIGKTPRFVHEPGRFCPVAGRDVAHRAVRCDPVEPLVGRRGGQRTERLDPGAQLDVVEPGEIEPLGEAFASRVPRGAQRRTVPADRFGQPGDLVRCGIAAHETDAGHRTPVAVEQPLQCLRIEPLAPVALQVGAVAARAAVRAVGDVDRQRRFVGNLGEDDVEVVVADHHPTPLWHNSAVRPPAGGLPRSSRRASCSRSRGSGSPDRASGTRGTPSGSACRCVRRRCIRCSGC